MQDWPLAPVRFSSRRSLPWLRKDLHFPPAAFFPLHALQLAGALSCVAAALCGALLLGRGGASAQGLESRARPFHTPPLVERFGALPAGPFLSAPNACPRESLAD